MIKVSDLKEGDIVKVNDNGTEREGIVQNINRDQRLACVNNGVQEFWYSPDQLGAIPLNEEQLLKLGFEKADQDGGVKYMKGPFRILARKPDNFSDLEIWYREDHRQFHQPLFVHELQNHYYQMTKVILSRP